MFSSFPRRWKLAKDAHRSFNKVGHQVCKWKLHKIDEAWEICSSIRRETVRVIISDDAGGKKRKIFQISQISSRSSSTFSRFLLDLFHRPPTVSVVCRKFVLVVLLFWRWNKSEKCRQDERIKKIFVEKKPNDSIQFTDSWPNFHLNSEKSHVLSNNEKVNKFRKGKAFAAENFVLLFVALWVSVLRNQLGEIERKSQLN